MVVELGVAFDVLVAAILFGIFFFQIRTGIGAGPQFVDDVVRNNFV